MLARLVLVVLLGVAALTVTGCGGSARSECEVANDVVSSASRGAQEDMDNGDTDAARDKLQMAAEWTVQYSDCFDAATVDEARKWLDEYGT